MRHKVSITVPSTTGVNKPAPELHAEYVEKACRLLAVLFGGFTALEGRGGWVSETFGLVVEPITVVYAACTEAKLEAGLPKVRALAAEIAEAMTQECVAVEVDGTLELVAAEAA